MNASLLRQSFDIVVECEPELVRRFYDIFFARYPQVRPMFGKTSRPAQEKMLTGALVAVLEHLEDAEWLQRTLGALGARHAGYGVTDEMYGWVAECMLATLAEICGEAWSPLLAAEWAAALGAIAGIMIEGSRSVAKAA